MYDGSLKKALGLPMQTPSLQLRKCLDVPSLSQIAAHHTLSNSLAIMNRFNCCPNVLLQRTEELKPRAGEYADLRVSPAISKIGDNRYNMDLLSDKGWLDKCYVGLVVGTFLSIRSEETGKILICRSAKLLPDRSTF